MQYKGLLVASLLVSSLAVNAQQYQDFTMKPGARVIKRDTGVKTPERSDNPLLAANMPATTGTKPIPAGVSRIPQQQEKYKPVPLAGHKSYFGDMNDYMMDFCRKYLEAHTQTLSVVKQRGLKQFSLIDNILKQNQIPKEL